jgi:molybdopterin converting factor small subunit
MRVRVQYTAQLRATVGRGEEELVLAEGSSLADLLSYLASSWDRAARAHILTDSGQPRLSLLLVVNGLAVAVSDAGRTILHAGDVITLMPPIAGG